MDFPEKIRLLRNEKKYSQEQMANLLGINQKAYSKIERGKTKLNYERLCQLAKIFDLTLSELINIDSRFLRKEKWIDTSRSPLLSVELLSQIFQKYDDKIVQIEKDLEHALKEIEKYKGKSS